MMDWGMSRENVKASKSPFRKEPLYFETIPGFSSRSILNIQDSKGFPWPPPGKTTSHQKLGRALDVCFFPFPRSMGRRHRCPF